MATQSIQFALDQGLKIFPLSRARKKPILKAWPERATGNYDLVEHWAERFPRCNWAAVTGEISDDVVIDVDGPEGRSSIADLEQKFGSLPQTLSVRTGRANGGQQLHFLNPKSYEIHNSVGKVGKGVDIRGWRGFVVIPNSIHPETRRQYAWENHFDRVELPEPWIDLIESTRRRNQREKRDTVREAISADTIPEPTHAAQHFGFRALLPGERHDGLLRSAGKLRRKGVSLDHITNSLLAENIRRCHPPLPVEEVLSLARDVYERYAPVTEPDVLELAWSRLNFCDAATTVFKPRSLAVELQRSQPNSHILLPQERLAALLGVDQQLISHICRRLVASGFMHKYSGYVPLDKAQGYAVSLSP